MTELMRLYSTDLRTGSDTLLDLGTTAYRWKNLYLSNTMSCASLTSSPVVSCSSTNAVVVVAQSSTVISMVGSSMTLSNSNNACFKVPVLLANPASPVSGNFWFLSSSNSMYLAVRSSSVTYFVQMST